MTLINNMDYEPPVAELSSEEDAINVLRDVRTSISPFDKNFLKSSLKHVLEVVDFGYSDFLKDGIVNRVDFSKARYFLQKI